MAAWEVPVPEVGRSMFVIPPEAFKTKRTHAVILNAHLIARVRPR